VRANNKYTLLYIKGAVKHRQSKMRFVAVWGIAKSQWMLILYKVLIALAYINVKNNLVVKFTCAAGRLFLFLFYIFILFIRMILFPESSS
jgi:hypothetical protein